MNKSFTEIITSSPRVDGTGRISFSQPDISSDKESKKKSKQISKRLRGSLSPENMQAQKKQATKFAVSNIPKCN